MNAENEPVAWMVENDGDISFILNGKGFAKPDGSWKSVTPVYTHPVRELTDGEIIELWKQFENDETPIRSFARAILQKSSEK